MRHAFYILSFPRVQPIYPDSLSELQGRYNLQAIVVTLGGLGSCAVGAAGETILSSGYETQVVDTIGTGDAFIAAFVTSLLKSDDLQAASEFANLYGAAVASQQGATKKISATKLKEIAKNPRITSTENDLQLTTADT